MSDFLPDKDIGCHRTGFEKSCRDLVAAGRCRRWVLIQGAHPQTDEPVNRYDCIDNWIPLLLMDVGRNVSQGVAGTDKVANEVRKFHSGMRELNGVEPLPSQELSRLINDVSR
jgi:hypothetical protein